MWEGWLTFYFECVYQTLILDSLKPGKFHISVKDETTVDACCGYDYVGMRIDARSHCCIVMMQHHILREASALSVLLRRAIPGPQRVEWATGTVPHAILFINHTTLEGL